MLGYVAPAGRARARVAIFHLARVPLDLPAAADTHDLDVGRHRLQRAEQREEALALAVLGEPLVGAGRHRERGPAVVEVGAEHAVAVHEADRRTHVPLPGPDGCSERGPQPAARRRAPARAPACCPSCARRRGRCSAGDAGAGRSRRGASTAPPGAIPSSRQRPAGPVRLERSTRGQQARELVGAEKMAHQRGGGEVKRPALDADHREQRREPAPAGAGRAHTTAAPARPSPPAAAHRRARGRRGSRSSRRPRAPAPRRG